MDRWGQVIFPENETYRILSKNEKFEWNRNSRYSREVKEQKNKERDERGMTLVHNSPVNPQEVQFHETADKSVLAAKCR